MKHEISTQWMGKMQFNALVNGHTVVMDAPERAGGEDAGSIPKPFILVALSGCTGMDVVSILRKQGIELKDMQVTVSGEISKTVPIVYTSIHVQYDILGEPADEQAVLDTVTLSQDKVCGVKHMLSQIMPVTWELSYNHKKLFSKSLTNQLVEHG